MFLTREMWTDIRGFDPEFKSRGGGLANHDIWTRLCSDPRNDIVLILGEGTFHQFHGGVATNAPVSVWPLLNEEYKQIRGEYYPGTADVVPILFGTLNEFSLGFLHKENEKNFRLDLFNARKQFIQRFVGTRGYMIVERLDRTARKFLVGHWGA